MALRTGIIRFNVNDRGRQFRGQPRNLDTRRLATIINGGSVQERVKNRDLQGYLGHWVRERFGMEPKEAIIQDGKVIPLEPALITVSLRADDDGNVEHEAEFLDTYTGRTAAKMWQSKVGGFSSAIQADLNRKDCDFPVGFSGFDYVREPNVTTNRGFLMDSVGAGAIDQALFDAVVADHAAALQAADATAQSALQELALTQQSMAALSRNYEYLLGRLASRPDAAAIGQMLDAAGRDFVRPTFSLSGGGRATTQQELAAGFGEMDLPGFEDSAGTKDDGRSSSVDGARLARKFAGGGIR